MVTDDRVWILPEGLFGVHRPRQDEIDVLHARIAALEAQIAQYRWRRMEEELPEKGWSLTRTRGSRLPAVLFFDARKNEWVDRLGFIRDVTHWMSLPEPPKEGE